MNGDNGHDASCGRRGRERPTDRCAGQGDRPDPLSGRHQLSRRAAHGHAVRRPGARAGAQHRHGRGGSGARRRRRIHVEGRAGQRIRPADQGPAGALRPGRREAGDRCRALRGRPGRARRGRDRGAGARGLQADPGRVGRPAGRPRPGRGDAARCASASPPQQGQRLLQLPHPQGRRGARASRKPT